MIRRTPIKRYTPVRKKRHGPETRIGKTGTIRLTGKALGVLRRDCIERDKGVCQECGIGVSWTPLFDGDPQAYDMAHIKSRGAGGSDVLDNVRCLCHSCHMKEHNCGGRPLSTNSTNSEVG